jgi:hypothetical protein
VTRSRGIGEALQLPDISAAEDHVVGLKRVSKPFHHVGDVLTPSLLAVSSQSAQADVVLVRPALPVREVGEFQRHEHAVADQRGSQTGPQTQEQHAPGVVASEGLHCGVIDQFHGTAERLLEVEIHPSLP